MKKLQSKSKLTNKTPQLENNCLITRNGNYELLQSPEYYQTYRNLLSSKIT